MAFEDDLIARAIKQLAAAIAHTGAAEVRAEAQVEIERAQAALGRARGAFRRGDLATALTEIERAIGGLVHLSPSMAMRVDAASLRALVSSDGLAPLAALFRARSQVLCALGLEPEADRSERIADALR
jgi:hypothetical protein